VKRVFLALLAIGATVMGPGANWLPRANADASDLPKALQGLKIGGVSYLAYMAGESNDRTYNQFELKRAYFDVQKTVTPYLTGRYTTDLTRIASGDWEIRTKYLYGKFGFNGGSFLTQSNVEFGQGHAPYHDFWEAINGYRVQGTMFLERNGVLNSADVGAVFGSNLGGEMDDDYKKNVDSHYAGKYGSVQVGVYNGGGYHAVEKNENKVPEARVTIRPVPKSIPGLQVSAFGVMGKGNAAPDPTTGSLPDFRVLNLMVSFESARFTATGEAYAGTGDQGGGSGDRNGYSFFGRLTVVQDKPWEVIARYDHFDRDIHVDTDDKQDRFIAGAVYRMSGGNLWLLDVERLQHSLDGVPDDTVGELALQISY